MFLHHDDLIIEWGGCNDDVWVVSVNGIHYSKLTNQFINHCTDILMSYITIHTGYCNSTSIDPPEVRYIFTKLVDMSTYDYD